MKTYIISAKSVGHLVKQVEAKDENEAFEMLNSLLQDGDMPEADGWIEGKSVELLQSEEGERLVETPYGDYKLEEKGKAKVL